VYNIKYEGGACFVKGGGGAITNGVTVGGGLLWRGLWVWGEWCGIKSWLVWC